MRTHDRLRIAIQKSGRLSEPARDLLARAGLTFREDRDRLFCHGETQPVDLLLVRDDDIPGLIADGVCDFGIVGRNVLEEHGGERRRRGEAAAVQMLRSLGFGRCRLAIAVPAEWEWPGPQRLDGLRIATSYPRLLERWLADAGVGAAAVVLSGSVEIAPRLGQADAVCDLVSTGATLQANQLREVATVFDSEAVLAAPATPFGDARAELAAQLLGRIDAVVSVRASKLVLFQAARAAIPALLRLLPEAEAPTMLAVEGMDDQVAMQALCRSTPSWHRLEEMKRAGANGLLVLPIERMLA
jgi:ATP phosphoribosyltransferase